LIYLIYEKLAKIVVEYSLEVQKGNYGIVVGPPLAKELFHAIVIEVLKTGAHIDDHPMAPSHYPGFLSFGVVSPYT
jgi:leucyl aminopeptidase (aminopeptidase T)